MEEDRGKLVSKKRTWVKRNEYAVFVEDEEVFHFVRMEGEVTQHENCLGPDCECWKKGKP